MASQDDHYKNPLIESDVDRNQMIAVAAAKGAGLALAAAGVVAFSGPRYSQKYVALSRSMKTFLLGSGKPISGYSAAQRYLSSTQSTKLVLRCLI